MSFPWLALGVLLETALPVETKLQSLFPAKTTSAEETRALGRQVARHLRPGSVVALYGDLGAGKTQLAKGVAGGLGIEETDVRSPTFVIAREYDGRWPEGHPAAGQTVPLYHLDAYRLAGPDDLEAVDYETYFFGAGLCIVEWPERVETLLPEDTLRLRLAHRGADRRGISRMKERE